MYLYTDKTKENKSRLVTNSFGQKKSRIRQGVGFVGNRPKPFIQNVIQRYTSPIINGVRAKVSINNNYIVDKSQEQKLFIRPGVAAPAAGFGIVAAGVNLAYNPGGGILNYVGYHYDLARAFQNDCLRFAENLARHTDVDSHRAEFRAVGDNAPNNPRLVGHTEQQNRTIAGGIFATNEQAAPNVGEAYGTLRTGDTPVGQCPYHAATVVAQDGTDRVTLEADAGAALAQPVFDIYGTVHPRAPVAAGAPDSLTFHETYGPQYTTGMHYQAGTGVLRLRNG